MDGLGIPTWWSAASLGPCPCSSACDSKEERMSRTVPRRGEGKGIDRSDSGYPDALAAVEADAAAQHCCPCPAQRTASRQKAKKTKALLRISKNITHPTVLLIVSFLPIYTFKHVGFTTSMTSSDY